MQSDTAEVPLHELLVEALAGNPGDNGFEVQYQPIVRLGGHANVAVEALVHWQHPVAGTVEPVQSCRRGSVLNSPACSKISF